MPTTNNVRICGVNVTSKACDQIDHMIRMFVDGAHARQIVTVNPEILYRAKDDKNFSEILSQADLQVIDGFGVVCALWWRGQRTICRMTGVEVMWRLLDQAQHNDKSVFLAANAFGLSTWEETRDVIHARYPLLRITGADMDPRAERVRDDVAADVVLCNFGAPYQEMFIHALVSRGSCRVGVGVGGAFDFATGKVRRAPWWMRRCGCEWVWRLVHQPWRWKRIMRAVVLFPLCVLRGK